MVIIWKFSGKMSIFFQTTSLIGYNSSQITVFWKRIATLVKIFPNPTSADLITRLPLPQISSYDSRRRSHRTTDAATDLITRLTPPQISSHDSHRRRSHHTAHTRDPAAALIGGKRSSGTNKRPYPTPRSMSGLLRP